MRTIIVFILCVAAVTLCRAPAQAATQQWTYGVTNNIVQVFADGKGGCAIATYNMTGRGEIIWLDRNGAPRFAVGVSNINAGLVLECTDALLVYTDTPTGPSNNVVYVVDSSGAATALPAAANTVNKSPGQGFVRQRSDDAKGFFAVNVISNDYSYSLVRYSSK